MHQCTGVTSPYNLKLNAKQHGLNISGQVLNVSIQRLEHQRIKTECQRTRGWMSVYRDSTSVTKGSNAVKSYWISLVYTMWPPRHPIRWLAQNVNKRFGVTVSVMGSIFPEPNVDIPDSRGVANSVFANYFSIPDYLTKIMAFRLFVPRSADFFGNIT